MVRRLHRDASVLNIESPADLAALEARLAQGAASGPAES
jgi:hypothetical protein